MHIEYISVENYRVLHNFELHMVPYSTNTTRDQLNSINNTSTPSYQLDLVVGINGTGKSTLLHLFAELFQRLATSNQPPPFLFTLRYTLTQKDNQQLHVEISNQHELDDRVPSIPPDQKKANEYYFRLNNDPPTLVPEIDRKYLPAYVVVFSSGKQEGWEIHDEFSMYLDNDDSLPQRGDAPEEEVLLELYAEEIGAPDSRQPMSSPILDPGTMSATNRFITIQNAHLPLIILCGLLADMHDNDPQREVGGILDEALKETHIKVLHGFSLTLKLTEQTQPEDRRFVEALRQLATYTVHYDETGSQFLLFFELFTERGLDTTLVRQLLELRGGLPIELFRALDRLKQPAADEDTPVIKDLHLFFDRWHRDERKMHDPTTLIPIEDREPLHRLDWLSDGELSFLGRLCLFSLLRNTEALILLDEPEVHFNDYWKHKLISRIDQSLRDSSSHVIMTTHSSITLSDIPQVNIHVLKRFGAFTQAATPPNVNTLGADPSEIIMYVFGAESASGAHSTEYIEEQINLIRRIKNPQDRFKRFDALAKNVGPGPLRYQIYRERLAAQNENLSTARYVTPETPESES